MPTVLYVHGLESGPRGKKVAMLRAAGFDVVAGQMPCGRRAVASDPVVISLLAACGISLVAATLAGGVLGFLIAGGAIAIVQQFVRPALVRRMVRRSLAVQLALLREHSVDAVVGSSFGGAVVIELIRRAAWRGPTLLLCPAHRLVATRGWLPVPTLPAGASRIAVVHGRQDSTVPIEHSRALVAGTQAKLIEVDDDHRLSASTTPATLEAWLAIAMAAQWRQRTKSR